MDMQVVIPMSGFGERFLRAGYTVPKPMIPVHGRPIIGHVVDMFPGVDDIIFICNRQHLETPAYRMRETLARLCPGGRIFAVEPHKLGPVHAVLKASALLDPARPTIINYCDFNCYWDFSHFAHYVEQLGVDGAIPAYTGFHPHMLGSTSYAYVCEMGGWVEDIQEKTPYTDEPMREYASSGTYYFKSGAMAVEYCQRAIEEGLALNGEYYASLVYKPMLRDKRKVIVYPLQHFMQWGTPEDLETYLGWSRAFEHLGGIAPRRARQAGAVMVPMAGAGSRFVREGYALPKPLIPVSGVPMVVQAARDLPQGDRLVFVVRRDMPSLASITTALLRDFPSSCIKVLDALTDGQARTCLLALDEVDDDQPLTIGACDNGVLYDVDRFEGLMADPDVDVIVWAARRHPNAARRPEMYGWIDLVGEDIRAVAVKKPLSNPASDPIIIGTFTFKRAADFRRSAERSVARNAQVSGEYYIDTCINDAVALGLRCVPMEVDAYLCWGTPDELRTFEYWQSCFHKWGSHPYRLEKDARASREVINALEAQFTAFSAELGPSQ